MANHVYIACSLDGFIAKPNGSIDWLTTIPNEKDDDWGYSRFIKKIDAIIIGRKTFETALLFGEWPYNRPVFVLSNNIKQIPDFIRSKAELINGDLHKIIYLLHIKKFNNIYIDGGQTIQSFLKADLIDEMIITTIPIILGNGIPLFGSIDKELEFKLVNSEVLNNYMVKSYYKRIRNNQK